MKKYVILYSLLLIIISSLLFSCNNKEMEKVILENEDPVVTIDNVSPLSGYISTEITITGTEFGMMADAVTVYIGETKLEVVSCEDNKIVARVPQGATSGKISVDVFGQRVDTEFLFDVLGEPGITSVNPVYGFVGDEITFTGHDLGVSKSNYNILFEGTEKTAEISGAPENEKIIVKVPENAKSGIIKLEISGKNVNLPLINGFTVLQHATVTGLVSNEGYAGGNIEISGTNLSPELLEEVVDLKPIKIVLSNGENEFTLENVTDKTTNEKIVAKLPDDIVAAEYTLSVSTSFEDITTDLTYTVKEKPEFQTISKSEAHVGAEIEITCSNMENVDSESVEVMFGEVEGNIISVSDNVIRVKVPQLEANTYQLKLSINGAEIDLGTNSQFKVLDTPQITSVNIEGLLHNETTALVTSGTKLVIIGKGFGTLQNNVTLRIGDSQAIINSIEDCKIEFTVPDNFSEGTISIQFPGIDAPVVYDAIIFKLLSNGTDITEYVMKNYSSPFTPDGNDMQRQGEWMKPLNWIVENRTEDGMAGFGLQLSTKYDETTGKTLALQTDWGFPLTMTDGKIYQNVNLVQGKYKLTANVTESAIAGSAYLAVDSDSDFSVTTENISETSLAVTQISSIGDVSVNFAISSEQEVSVGFIATLNTKQKYIKVQSFKLTYEGTSTGSN